jgi:hypothetical protein
MRVLKLNSQGAFEESQNAIHAKESFQLIVEGFTAKVVRRLRPFFQSHWGPKNTRITRIEGLRYAMYALFTGSFGAIYYAAFKAGMVADWEDTGPTLVVSFEMKN